MYIYFFHFLSTRQFDVTIVHYKTIGPPNICSPPPDPHTRRQSAPRHRHEAIKREDGSCQRRRPPGDGVDDVNLPVPDRRFRNAFCFIKPRSKSRGDGGEVVTVGGEDVGGYLW